MNNREAFEAWAEKELLPLDRRDSEHYRYNLTNRAWAGWKAGLASQAQQSTKLVFDSESARQFLLENVLPKFSDSTFQKYVLEELAGDFAYQLVMYLQSQAQQTKIKPALKVVNGEICYQSTDDDQAYGMWCPVVYDTVHDFAEGTKFFAIPPAPDGGDK